MKEVNKTEIGRRGFLKTTTLAGHAHCMLSNMTSLNT